LVCCLTPVLQGQDRIEFVLSAWRIEATGTMQSGIAPVDLRADLALKDTTAFFGRLVLFHGVRHGIVIEGLRVELEGVNNLLRSVVFNGRVYDVRDTIESDASLDTIYAGYQYSVVRGPRGRLSLGAGAAYLGAYGSIRSEGTGISAAREHRIAVPLAATEARFLVLPRSELLEAAGDLKGMAFGRFGYYVQGSIHAGINLRWLGLRVGYMFVDADVHEDGGRVGIAPRLSGPAFSVVFRR
jgi:hypothetical protein